MQAALAGSTILIAVATPREASALCRPLRLTVENLQPWVLVQTPAGFDVVLTGVGKANAAGGVARVLDPDRHAGLLNVGIAGLLPQPSGGGLDLGSAILSTRSVFADDGIQQPEAFQSFADAGFPLIGSRDDIEPSSDWGAVLAELTDAQGTIATVSTCSGTDLYAQEIGERTGAIAEACEGAACGLSAFRVGCRFAEIRSISNTTGQRDLQRWDIDRALARLEEIFANTDLPRRLIETVLDARAD